MACRAYANLIYATMKSCADKGWNVVSASPLNEPDYVYNNQGSKDDFLAIARLLKTEYPHFSDGEIRLSGGNTLNCDEAAPWYDYLKEYLDEGNTHQLAGDFDHYADFFTHVREDGRYATADELHNVMEAMVGVEYGMQTGIWWGTAEYARGEFCRASFGERLAYAENRPAWTAASVYRSPSGKIQAFCGTSERQAQPSSFRFVSTGEEVYYDGQGPSREYLVNLPGGYGYQDGQTNAECVVDISFGEDVRPLTDGRYAIMNQHSLKVLTPDGGTADLTPLVQKTLSGDGSQLWDVKPVPTTIGGDFSYYTISLASAPEMKLDVLNWSLDAGGGIILFNGATGANEQWYLKYDGDGYFHILSRHSNLCLEVWEDSQADGIAVRQAEYSDSPRQRWRLLPEGAPCETVAPDAPAGLTATSGIASVQLEWTPSASEDVAAYTILRAKASDGIYNTIARDVAGCSFLDNSGIAGVEYLYKISAVDKSLNRSACTSSASGSFTGTPALIAHYTFENSHADMSGNHLDADGTANTYGTGCLQSEKSLRLRGNGNFLQLPTSIARNRELSVAAWARRGAASQTQYIFNFNNGEACGLSLSFTIDGKPVLSASNKGAILNVEGEVLDKEWHHLAATIGEDEMTLYVDGVAVGSALLSPEVTLSAIKPTVNYIACNANASDNFFVGYLDDLRIYNYALYAMAVSDIVDEAAGLESILTNPSPVVARTYYDLSGREVTQPAKGIYIVKRTHADGSVTTIKTSI